MVLLLVVTGQAATPACRGSRRTGGRRSGRSRGGPEASRPAAQQNKGRAEGRGTADIWAGTSREDGLLHAKNICLGYRGFNMHRNREKIPGAGAWQRQAATSEPQGIRRGWRHPSRRRRSSQRGAQPRSAPCDAGGLPAQSSSQPPNGRAAPEYPYRRGRTGQAAGWTLLYSYCLRCCCCCCCPLPGAPPAPAPRMPPPPQAPMRAMQRAVPAMVPPAARALARALQRAAPAQTPSMQPPPLLPRAAATELEDCLAGRGWGGCPAWPGCGGPAAGLLPRAACPPALQGSPCGRPPSAAHTSAVEGSGGRGGESRDHSGHIRTARRAGNSAGGPAGTEHGCKGKAAAQMASLRAGNPRRLWPASAEPTHVLQVLHPLLEVGDVCRRGSQPQAASRQPMTPTGALPAAQPDTGRRCVNPPTRTCRRRPPETNRTPRQSS